MSDILVLLVFFSFTVFLVARRGGKYAAVLGWAGIVLNLWSDMPAYLQENNFLYPALALASLPFLAITAGRLLREDPVVLQLSRTAAIATIIFVPSALIPVVRDALVSLVTGAAFSLITAFGHHPLMLAWDIMAENNFTNQIIVNCTGILAIAMLLGAAFGAQGVSRRQAVLSFLLIVPTIAVLNLLRVAVVFIAVSGRWFQSFPDFWKTGDPNFFWAHNVFAESIAIAVMVLLVYGLFRINPGLGAFARETVRVYHDGARRTVTAVKGGRAT